jgi:hypothetical protein
MIFALMLDFIERAKYISVSIDNVIECDFIILIHVFILGLFTYGLVNCKEL